MTDSNASRIQPIEEMKRAGCWGSGLFAFALFFGIGALIALLNGDFLSMLKAAVMTLVLAGVGWWVVRRRNGSGQ